MCYIRPLCVEDRNLRYIRTLQDKSQDIRQETPSVQSVAIYLVSAIHLLPVELNSNLLDSVFSVTLWANVQVSQGRYNLLFDVFSTPG